MNAPDPLLSCLRDIRRLLEEAAERSPRRNLTHADHLILGKLLPAIAGSLGPGVTFTAGELLDDPVFRALVGLSAHDLGILFSRSIGLDICGLRISRVAQDHGRSVWVVQTGP